MPRLETVLPIECLKEKEDKAQGEAWTQEEWEPIWIEAAKKGERESFERIVLAYQQKVFNLAFRLLGDREDAQDITQDVFLSVFKHLKQFRGESQFATWIYQVTLNHCRNRLNYMKRRFRHATESLDVTIQGEEGELEKDYPDEGDLPEDALYRKQVQRIVQKALKIIRPDYREVIVLRDIQGLSYQEIGEILGLAEGTIKSRLHRARWELKELLVSMGIKRSK